MKVLTPLDVGKALGIHRETVYGLVRSGALKAVKLGDGPKARMRITEDELARFVGEDLAPAAASFASEGANGVDLDAASLHLLAMRDLEARGITEPTADEYAAALLRVDGQAPTFPAEEDPLHVRALELDPGCDEDADRYVSAINQALREQGGGR